MVSVRLGGTRVTAAFTLIELLIVVAIIGILAAIAVPNFLNAQIRAKVARVKGDFQAVATAIESYFIDYGDYPLNDGKNNVLPVELTTPVAYLPSARLRDPFSVNKEHPQWGDLTNFYTYTRIVTSAEASRHAANGRIPPIEGIDAPGMNPGARKKYGHWRLVSKGPDGEYMQREDNVAPFGGIDVPYDPSNGTTSWGNILRTQKSPEGC